MRYPFILIAFLMVSSALLGQKKIDKTLKQLNTESVPYVHSAELTDAKNIVFLDTRKKEEFEVSHIKNAVWVGYDSFREDLVKQKLGNKNAEIVVYCSIGVRSEDIGEKLLDAGYTNVKNLYGGIFLWKNQGNIVYSENNIATDSIHAFDKHWGKLLTNGVKVYSSN